MDLKFSHIDVLVNDLEAACRYYAHLFCAEISSIQAWDRGGLRVRYAMVRFGQERFILVQPFQGNLKDLLDSNGEGTIYRHCYTTPNIEAAYDAFVARGVQPEDENGNPLAKNSLGSPSGARILWLPKKFGSFSIELLEESELNKFIQDIF